MLIKAGMLQNIGWGLIQVQRQLELPCVSVGVVHWKCNKRISKVKDVVGGQDVKIDCIIFLCGKGRANHHLKTDGFIIKGAGPAVLLVIVCEM